MKRLTATLLLVATALTVGAPAAAASTTPFWIGEVEALNGAIGPDAIARRDVWLAWQAERIELRAANGPYVGPAGSMDRAAGRRVRTYRSAVERWRPLVETYFLPDDVPWAMRVLDCESSGDPDAKNPRSTASGLFQHLSSHWPDRSAKAGWRGAAVFDPVANVAVAAWLFYLDGPRHWVCR